MKINKFSVTLKELLAISRKESDWMAEKFLCPATVQETSKTDQVIINFLCTTHIMKEKWYW